MPVLLLLLLLLLLLVLFVVSLLAVRELSQYRTSLPATSGVDANTSRLPLSVMTY